MLVEVGVVHERARAWRREANGDGIAHRYRAQQLRSGSTPVGHAIGETLQLNTVPVHGRWFVRAIQQRNRHRLILLEHQRRSWNGQRGGIRLCGRAAEHIRVSGLVAESVWSRPDQQPDWARLAL